MDHPDPEEHPDTPQVSPVKAINLNNAFSPDKKMQFNKYARRRAREAGQTPIAVKRLSKAARTRAAAVDKDDMYAYVKEEITKVEARMLECMTAFKSEMMGEMHTLAHSMYAKWKEEMQIHSQKEMTAQLKAELVPLEAKIHTFMAKDMLKLVHEGLKAEGKAMKEACKQEVTTAVETEIQRSKEAIAAMEASVSKVQENVEKKVHTWAEMAKDAVDKEVKECAPWIEVVKKNKGMPSNQTEVMNATLEEEAKRRVRALRIRVVGWAEAKTAKEDAEALCSKLGVESSLVLDAWRVGDVSDKRGRILMLKFEDIVKKDAFLAKRSGLKGEKTYLDEDLTPAQVAHRKECMPKVLEARKQGKFAVYRNGRVIIADRKAR